MHRLCPVSSRSHFSQESQGQGPPLQHECSRASVNVGVTKAGRIQQVVSAGERISTPGVNCQRNCVKRGLSTGLWLREKLRRLQDDKEALIGQIITFHLTMSNHEPPLSPVVVPLISSSIQDPCLRGTHNLPTPGASDHGLEPRSTSIFAECHRSQPKLSIVDLGEIAEIEENHD